MLLAPELLLQAPPQVLLPMLLSAAQAQPTASSGFRINNVSGNTDQMFPVGTDFVSSNRMALNMNGVANNDYTVVVGKGDIGNTPLPRVNRIWYVSQTYTTGTTATMKLYFTKRDWSSSPFGSAQDEIEDGFLYNDPHLIQKNSVNQFFNNASSTDVIDYSNNSTYPYDITEIYGLYTKGISPDLNNNKNGIIGFYRFS